MKLADLQSKSTTSLELIHPKTGDKCGVIIEGYTPDSKEFKLAQKKIAGVKKTQHIIIEKNASKLELDSDSGEKRTQLLIEIVTGISGVDDFKSTPESIATLLKQDECGWILEQWGEHLDDRQNFF